MKWKEWPTSNDNFICSVLLNFQTPRSTVSRFIAIQWSLQTAILHLVYLKQYNCVYHRLCHYKELIAKVRFWGRLYKPSNNEKSHKILLFGLMSNCELKLLCSPVISKPYQIERRLAWNSGTSMVMCVQPCIKPSPEKLKDSSCLYSIGQWSIRRDNSGFAGNQFPYIYFHVTKFKRVCSGMESWQSRSKLKTLFASLTASACE